MTGILKTETRVTKWVECKDGPWYPNMDSGGIVAYRIWVQTNHRNWWQRHEWKHVDGTIVLDEWIDSIRGWGTAHERVEE